jgi:ATP-dependent protease HslVU (ClpYQ) peptidase subunit
MPTIGNISVLILSHEGVRIFESSGLCTPVERGWQAVGSGANAAMGAYMMCGDAKKAVEAACQIDTGSGGAVVVHKLKN